jgi:Protein of unknown function (DUF3667)
MEKHPDHCLNCQHPLEEHDVFCSACGQKTDAHLLTVKELLSTFWNSLFNLDNTFFSTIKYIWAPWKLTWFYVSGKRKSFLNPMRLFIITLLFHFGYLVSLTSSIDNKTTRSLREYSELERSKMFKTYLALKDKTIIRDDLCGFTDSLEHQLFRDIVTPDKDTFFVENIFNIDKFPITRSDAIELKIDSLYKKYNITSFTDKFMVKQMIKLNLDRAGMIKYGIGNAAWGVLFVIIGLAGLFKILYYRQKIHYVSHLVLLMNIHSFLFLVVTFAVIASRQMLDIDTANGLLGLFLAIFLPVYFFISLRKYYGQRFFKTLIKFIISGLAYMLIGSLVILLVSIGSLVFF